MRVAYQGEPGAYSEEAVVNYFGPDACQPVPCETFDDAFERLLAGQVEAAVLPVENSYAGDVGEVYDLLRRNDVWIHDELALPVRHCLMALPGVTLAELRSVRSHPQALSQCRDYLRRHGLRAEPIHDTAAAARQVAAEGRRDLGAIAARRAASHYGLAVLAEGIQDAADNTTRFLVIAAPGASFHRVAHRADPLDGAFSPASRPQAKTYLLFAVADRPGALYRCLAVLAEREINMTKLTSRPFPGRPWYYMFFADLDGTIED
ncbi:MAG TPA: prephenate dehydratase, partial [Bacillota bacterium]